MLRQPIESAQYASRAYRERLVKHGFLASMSRKGNCWDNAIMERFFGSLKSEWLEGQRYWTRLSARRDVVTYIEMEYNSCRPLDPWLPRAEGDRENRGSSLIKVSATT